MSPTHTFDRAILIVASLAAAAIAPLAHAQTPLGTSFTYQGVLKNGGSAYNGAADVQFRLYDTASGGVGIGGTLSYSALAISDGLITASLNFGSTAFDGNDRWLEIAVRAPAGAGSFTTLTPRQKIAAAPYALWALNSLIAGAQPNQVSLSNASNSFTGSSLAIDGSTLSVDSANHRVGIGTTSPVAALHVAEGGGAQPSLVISKNADTSTSLRLAAPIRQWLIGQNLAPDNGPYDAFFIHDETAGATRLSIDTAGQVGIGTQLPGARLHVRAGNAGVAPIGGSTLTLESTSNHYLDIIGGDTVESGLLFGRPSAPATNANSGIIYNNVATPDGLQFRTGGNNNRMIIDSSGNVGIGIASPTAKLHVNGSIAISPATRIENVSPLSFRPFTSTTQYLANGGILWGLTTGQAVLFEAPVSLPNGAVVTEMRCYFLDNQPGSEMQFGFARYLWGEAGSSFGIGTATSSADSSLVQQATISNLPFTINNFAERYGVVASFTVPAGNQSNMSIPGVRITYTVTSPLP